MPQQSCIFAFHRIRQMYLADSRGKFWGTWQLGWRRPRDEIYQSILTEQVSIEPADG